MGVLAKLGLRTPERTSLTTPPAGHRTLQAKSDGWYDVNSAGVATLLNPTTGAPGNFAIDGGSATTTYPANAFKIDFGAAT